MIFDILYTIHKIGFLIYDSIIMTPLVLDILDVLFVRDSNPTPLIFLTPNVLFVRGLKPKFFSKSFNTLTVSQTPNVLFI